VFVDRLDFRSGVGRQPVEVEDTRRKPDKVGVGPSRIITNLGIIDFGATGPTVTSLHPGVTVEEIRAATGFQLSVAEDVSVTPPPSVELLRLIRSEIDPLGLRDLEFASSSGRREMIRAILAREAASKEAAQRL
jgi:hypothetical protein